MQRTERVLAVFALVLNAAIFGFFFAWVCSTMWGLDRADPRVAIEAMQEMNASVRNWVFFPAFFLTPLVTGAWAITLRRSGRGRPALLAAGAAVLYLLGGIVFTQVLNIPMNEALAQVEIPRGRAEAAEIWQDYSSAWQLRNIIRTVFSGICVVLVGFALRGAGRCDHATSETGRARAGI